MGGGGPSAPPVDYGAYWTNYMGWRTEAASTGSRTMATARARMASSGMQPGTEQWNTNISAAEKAMNEDIAEIEGGFTATELQKDYQFNWKRIDKNWKDDYGVQPITTEGPGAPPYVDGQGPVYEAPETKQGTAYDATLHQFYKGQYYIDPTKGSILDVKEGAEYSDFDFDSGPVHGQRYRQEDVQEYGKLQYMKEHDTGGVYDTLKDKFGRAPQNWEYYAALTYGLGDDESSAEDAAKAATDVARASSERGPARGLASPGLTRTAEETTRSPWV